MSTRKLILKLVCGDCEKTVLHDRSPGHGREGGLVSLLTKEAFTGGLRPALILTDPLYDDMEVCNQDRLNLFSRNASVIVFGPAEFHSFSSTPTELHHWLKQPSTKNTAKKCSRFVEHVSVWNKTGTFNAKQMHWSSMTGVHLEQIESKPIHPFQKPLALIEKLIRLYSNPGDLVVDPFLGSGTMGVAAVRLGRGFIGFERDKVVYDAAKARIMAEVR